MTEDVALETFPGGLARQTGYFMKKENPHGCPRFKRKPLMTDEVAVFQFSFHSVPVLVFVSPVWIISNLSLQGSRYK